MMQEMIRNMVAPGGRTRPLAQVLRNSRTEFRLLALAQRYALQISFRGRLLALV